MSKAITTGLLLILLTSFISISSNKPVSKKTSLPEITLPEKNSESLKKFASMKIRDFEKMTGKKLKLKEKIAFKILQLKTKSELNKPEQEKGSKKGNTAFILGVIGLSLLVLGVLGLYVAAGYALIPALVLGIIAVIMGNQVRKEYPQDKKAKTAVLLGWITLGLLAFLLLLALIVAATWSW